MLTEEDYIPVQLNQVDVDYANAIGDARIANKKSMGYKPRKISEKDQRFIDRNGAAGEVVFGKHFGYSVDTSGKAKPEDFFFRLRSGYILSIDVKTTHHYHGKLIVPYGARIGDVDAYVLVIGEDTYFRIIGWVQTWHIIDKKNLLNPCKFGGLKGYCMEQKFLQSMNTLEFDAINLEEFDSRLDHEYIATLPPEQLYSPPPKNPLKLV